MVQTVHSETIPAGQKMILVEKPCVLHRIFFSISVLRANNEWFASKVSFDDPLFRSFFVLDGPERYFEARGQDIFQGNVWVQNVSSQDILYSMTEILH